MSRKLYRSLSQRALLAVLVCAFGTVGTGRAQGLLQGPASIRGQVADLQGNPLAGALVSVAAPNGLALDKFAVTDRLGAFSIPGLGAGQYLVRVTKSQFLPAAALRVELLPGSQSVLTINLQTAIDVVRRGIRRGSLEDMQWVLRSSPSTRPILRHRDDPFAVEESVDAQTSPAEPTGYLQVYSSTMEAADGQSDAVGSQFAVTLPVPGGAQVRVEGQYTESQGQPRGLGATYEFSSGSRKRSSLGVNVRQGAHLNGPIVGAEQREIAVEYVEQVQWSDDLVLHFGATAGRAESISDLNYVRPELGAAWVVGPRTTLQATFSRRAPTDTTDPIRGREYFDRSVYIPPELERFSHVEAGMAHILSNGVRVSASVFRDELGTQAFLIDAEDGRRAVMILDSTGMPTSGLRLVLDRAFENFEATLGYTYASAPGFDPDVASPEDLRQAATRRGYHVVTARLRGTIELTQTQLTAIYRWAPGYPLAPLDPYQSFAEYNDPTLSLTLAQDLPSTRLFPAKVQAVLDARNIFEPSFGSRRTVNASHPRILKGGIHFKF